MINEIKNETKELKETDSKLFDDNTTLNNKINEITTKTKELKETDCKLIEDNTILSNQMNEIKMENKEFKDHILQSKTKFQSGDHLFDFYDNYDEYKYMMNGNDWREAKHHVTFDVKYDKNPKVIVSINQLDYDKNKNLRINVLPADIDSTGFDLKIQTWEDTSLHSVRLSWISFE